MVRGVTTDCSHSHSPVTTYSAHRALVTPVTPPATHTCSSLSLHRVQINTQIGFRFFTNLVWWSAGKIYDVVQFTDLPIKSDDRYLSSICGILQNYHKMLRDDRAGRADSPQWKNYRENCWTSFELVSTVSSVLQKTLTEFSQHINCKVSSRL